jgi:hypothetical protein
VLRGSLWHGGTLPIAAQGGRLDRGDRREDFAEANRLARRAAEFGTDDAIALDGAAMALPCVIGDLDIADDLVARALALDSNSRSRLAPQRLIKGWSGEL